MALTAKREAFAVAVVRLGEAVAAYKASHAAGNMATATIRKRASELRKRPDVAARIDELQAAAAKEAGLDRALVLRELHRLAKMAMGDIPIRKVVTQGRGKNAKPVEILLHHVDIQGAARAWELIGKADPIRLFVEQHEHSGRGGGPIMTEDAPMGDVERARRVAYILMRGAEAQTEKAENA